MAIEYAQIVGVAFGRYGIIPVCQDAENQPKCNFAEIFRRLWDFASAAYVCTQSSKSVQDAEN